MSSLATRGVEGLIIQTRDWGKTVAFWQEALVYQVEFEGMADFLRLAGSRFASPERLHGEDEALSTLGGNR